MFETNLRDERFLPFEGAGAAESRWRLELPSDFPSFDYMTISDVVMHIRDTARQGGDLLGNTALSEFRSALANTSSDSTAVGTSSDTLTLPLFFSLRYDFPTEWSAFINGTGDFTATIRRDYFPYFAQGKTLKIVGFDLYAQDATKHKAAGDPDAATTALAGNAPYMLTVGPDAAAPQVLTRAAGAQVFLIIRYSLGN